jgi:phosphinothricin acetyltransferase
MPSLSCVRDATTQDAAACAAIYTPYVLGTAVTFEIEPPSARELARRISSAQATHAWLVLQDRDEVVGYAYAVPYKSRPAYRWSCEVSVYVDSGRHRSGVGRALYEALLARLAERGYRIALAGMTLPNEASVGLHRALGFEHAGTLRGVGWKLGAWHDVALMQRPLAIGGGPPAEPR